MRSFPVLKGGHDAFNTDKNCRCHYHQYLASSLLYLDHQIRDHRLKQRRQFYFKKYAIFSWHLFWSVFFVFIIWCFPLDYIATYHNDWYISHKIYYAGIALIAITYAMFGIVIISVIHNTPLLYVPNIILFLPVCACNVAALALLAHRESKQVLPTTPLLCHIFQCKFRTLWWLYIDALAIAVPFLVLIPFFLLLVRFHKYSVEKQRSQRNAMAYQKSPDDFQLRSSQSMDDDGYDFIGDSLTQRDPSMGSLTNIPSHEKGNLIKKGKGFMESKDDSNEKSVLSTALMSDNHGQSTLINAGHIVIDRHRTNSYSISTSIRPQPKRNDVGIQYCCSSIFSVERLFWLYIPPCQDQANAYKLYGYTSLYILMLLVTCISEYFFAQLKIQRIQNYFIEVYLVLRVLLFIYKQLMKVISRRIDALRLNYVDEELLNTSKKHVKYDSIDIQSIPFRDQISVEFFSEFLTSYLYYDAFRYLFVVQKIEWTSFAIVVCIHLGMNILDNFIRPSDFYHSLSEEIVASQQNKCSRHCISSDMSSDAEWRFRISADINVQFISCVVNALFWYLVIPAQLQHWMDHYKMDVEIAIAQLSITLVVDTFMFIAYICWYGVCYKLNIVKSFIAIYNRHGYKLVCCLAMIAGTLSQKWFFVLEKT